MEIENIFKIIYIITFVFIFVEYTYSKYKKDNIHYFFGTLNNVINGLMMKYVVGFISSAYFFYLVSLSLKKSIPSFDSNLILNTFYCLILFDFFHYLFHRAHHHFNFLWMFHHVHHSDKHFNLSTSYRLSLIEKIYNATPCLPLLLIGLNPYTVLLAFSIHSLFAFFGHTQYVKLPKFVNYIFITPQTHAIHHDENHLNNNYAIIFSFWDRLFGTYVDKIDTFTPGIKGYSQDNFIRVQTDPIIEYFKKWKK